MGLLTVFVFAILAIGCLSQNTGDLKENVALKFPIEVCQSEGNCQKVSTSVSLDSNWHWIHDSSGTNCYDGNMWDSVKCPDAATCTSGCLLEGSDQADWGSTYGVTVDGSGGMELQFVTVGQYSTNIGSRMFVLDESGDAYYMFKLKNKEFTMDVDTSELPCGLNGAVYFVEMDADGGLHYPSNKAGPPYGTGYCDAQCPHDLKWVNGEANCDTWIPSDVDPNSGFGKYGSCCFELDIWEANTISTVFTNHPCDVTGQYRCELPEECGDNGSDNRYDGVCDKDGCDFNHWRMGDETFYGPGSNFKVDSSKPLTLVTQFITDDGTDNGNLVEMRRFYIQNGNIIANNVANIPGMQAWDSVSQPMCDEQKKIFDDPDDHTEKGGMKTMGESMDRGQVLVMSIWADAESHMLWLDSTFPADSSSSEPGNSRGSCPTDSGLPSDLQNNYGDATVKYFNVKIGPLGSTFPGDAPTNQPPTTTTSGPNPTPSTSTSGPGPTTTTHGGGSTCPGGSLDVCISLCPDEPAEIYQKCVQQCIADCT